MLRISDPMIASGIVARLGQASERLFRLQEQVASGLAFRTPSQDPSGAVRASALRSSIAEVTRYLSNADDAAGWLSLTEGCLASISRGLQEARSAALARTDAMPEGNLALADQVHQIAIQIVRDANSTSEGRYLFAGHKVLTPPLAENPLGVPPYLYQGDRGATTIQLGRGITIKANLDAAEVLNLDGAADPAMDDVLETLRKLEVALRANDHDGTAACLEALERHAGRIVSLRAELGARMQHIELAKTRLEDAGLTLQGLLSQVQDADLTKVVIELRSQEIGYQAAAAAASSLHRASLLDYLR